MDQQLPSIFSPSPSPSPSQEPSPDASGELQFERAETSPTAAPAGPVACAACGTVLRGSYFEINGKAACESCRNEAERLAQASPGAAGFVRALGAGATGGVAGALVYFIVLKTTGYQVGLIGILVGFLVGRGVHWGARGRGGWLYQGLAVVLTYLAIVGTYVPLILDQIDHRVLNASLILTAYFYASMVPFFAVKQGRVMGLVIIGIALYEAWKLNRPRTFAIGGPYPIAARSLAAPAGGLAAGAATPAAVGGTTHPAAPAATGPAAAARPPEPSAAPISPR
jgi:hypothetical protein